MQIIKALINSNSYNKKPHNKPKNDSMNNLWDFINKEAIKSETLAYITFFPALPAPADPNAD